MLMVRALTAIGFAGMLALAPLGAAAAQAVPSASAGNPAAVRAYAGVLQKINPQMPAWQSRELARHLLINANRWKLDANILVALVSVESAWHTHARSDVGAMGLGQLMPGTARLLHVNPHDPYQNLQGAARYLGGLLSRYHGKRDRYALAFAAYNAGPHAVALYGGIPPYAETQNYVVRVMSAWQRVAQVVRIPMRSLALRAAAARRRLKSEEARIDPIEAAISPDLPYWAGSKNQ